MAARAAPTPPTAYRRPRAPHRGAASCCCRHRLLSGCPPFGRFVRSEPHRSDSGGKVTSLDERSRVRVEPRRALGLGQREEKSRGAARSIGGGVRERVSGEGNGGSEGIGGRGPDDARRGARGRSVLRENGSGIAVTQVSQGVGPTTNVWRYVCSGRVSDSFVGRGRTHGRHHGEA